MITALRQRGGLILFAVAILVGSVAAALGQVDPELATPFVATAVLAIIIGEQMPTRLTQRVIAPLTTAPALGLILAPLGMGPEDPTAETILGIIWLSMLVGVLIARARGRSVVEGSLGARFLGMVVTAFLARNVDIGGVSLVEWAFDWETRRIFAALGLLAAALIGGAVERFLEALVVWGADGGSPVHALVGELRPLAGIAMATASSGPLIALAYPVLDWVALPLLLLPVLLTHLAVQRAVAIRTDLGESVRAMSRLGEAAGRTRVGHSRRVAELSLAIGRDMGLDQETLGQLERTALLHDVGQLGLAEPIDGGATIHASTTALDQMALAGTRIVTSSPLLEQFAPLVDQVHTPFRRSREFGEYIPLVSRIVRVANAWDDITEGTTSKRARAVALERLHLGLGYDYDPEVVAVLERSLE